MITITLIILVRRLFICLHILWITNSRSGWLKTTKLSIGSWHENRSFSFAPFWLIITHYTIRKLIQIQVEDPLEAPKMAPTQTVINSLALKIKTHKLRAYDNSFFSKNPPTAWCLLGSHHLIHLELHSSDNSSWLSSLRVTWIEGASDTPRTCNNVIQRNQSRLGWIQIGVFFEGSSLT